MVSVRPCRVECVKCLQDEASHRSITALWNSPFIIIRDAIAACESAFLLAGRQTAHSANA